MEDQTPVRKFFESSFTLLAIGAVLGVALASPHSFTYAFIGSGIALFVGLLRAKFLEKETLSKRIIGNVGLCILLGAVCMFVWMTIPKPVESPSTEQIANAIINKQRNQEGDKKPETKQDLKASEIAAEVFKKLPQQNPPAPTLARKPLPAISTKRLVRMATDVAHLMEGDAGGNWFVEDERLHTDREVAVQSIIDPEQLKRRLAEIDQNRQALNKRHTGEVRLLVDNADQLRQELLDLLAPEQEQTDREAAVVFDKVLASVPITHFDLGQASRYLEDLANRVSSSAK